MFKIQDRYSFQGLPISIETKAGTTRSGVDPDGHSWEVTSQYDYGYIRGILGEDDEELDVYIGPNRKAENAYIVKQHAIEKVKEWPSDHCPSCEKHSSDCACPQYFDEDKVMLGFDSKQAAIDAYNQQYDNPLFLGPVVTVSIEDFKSLVRATKGKISFDPVLNSPLQLVYDESEEALNKYKNDIKKTYIKRFKSRLETSKTIIALKSAFFSFMDVKAAKHERTGRAMDDILNPDSSINSVSNAVQFMLSEDAMVPQEILEKLGRDSEPFLANTGVNTGKEIGILDDAGEVKKELAEVAEKAKVENWYHASESMPKWQKAHENFVALAEQEKPYLESPEFTEEGLAELQSRIKAAADEVNKLSEIINEDALKIQAEVAAEGEKIILGLMDLSPVSESEAMRWAKSQIFSKQAKSRITRNYSMKAFYHDMADFYRLCGGRLPYLRVVSGSDRPSAAVRVFTYNLGTKISRSVNFHEMTHLLENNPMVKAAANTYLHRRAQENGESEPRPLNDIYPDGNFEEGEVAYSDHFYNAYMGKKYPNGDTEIFTMLTQELSDPVKTMRLLAQDPESFKFMMGLLGSANDEDREFANEEAAEADRGEAYRAMLLTLWDELADTGLVKTVSKNENRTNFSLSTTDGKVHVYEQAQGGWLSGIAIYNDSPRGFADRLVGRLAAMEGLLYGFGDVRNAGKRFKAPAYAHDEFAPSAPPPDLSNKVTLNV